MLGSGLLLLIGNLTIGILMVGRNVLIANFVTVEHYGIAMTFAVTVALIELTANLMHDTYVVRSENGDEPRTLKALHLFAVLRGILNAVLLFLAGPYIAQIFQVPDLAWAYQIIAVIPLLRGFSHIDMFRFQRHGKFRPKVIMELSAYLASLFAAWGAVLYFGDFRAMLVTIFVQWMVFFLLSHIFAERKYSIGWDGVVLKDLFAFGWPLMLNAMLIYAIQNGDRIIVGNQLGPEVLGWFSAAFMLAQTPSMLLMNARRTLFMPQISRKGPHQAQAHLVAIEVALWLGIGFAVAIAIAGPYLLTALFGERYLQAVTMMLWLGLIFGLRIARSGLITTAIAQGDTTKVLNASLVRVLALPAAFYLLQNGGTIWALMVLICVAELITFAVSFYLVRDIAHKSLSAHLSFLVVLGLCYLVINTTEPVIYGALRFEPLAWLLILALGTTAFAMPNLVHWLRQELGFAEKEAKKDV